MSGCGVGVDFIHSALFCENKRLLSERRRNSSVVIIHARKRQKQQVDQIKRHKFDWLCIFENTAAAANQNT